jgi:hypothetical protein
LTGNRVDSGAFFLEGNDLFIAPIQMFFSRRIAPRPHDRVLFGLQAVGKQDGLAFSALDVVSREERPDGTVERVNAAVARLQKDLGARSSLSVIGVSRAGDQTHGVVGADANIHIWEEIFVQAQAVKSASPGPSAGAEAYHVGVHRFDTTTEFWLQYEDIGKRFANPLGFIPVTDKQSVYAHLYHNAFTKIEALPRVDITYDDLWRMDHEGRETRHLRKLNLVPYMSHDFAFTLDGQWDKTGGYENRIGSLGFVLFPNDWQSLTFTTLMGSFLGGDLLGLNGALSLKVGPRFVIKLNGFYTLSGDVPPDSPLFGGAALGGQWSFYSQLRYHLSPDLYARLTFQRGHVFGVSDLNSVEGQVVDAVLGWHYRLGSDVFLVYTQQPFRGAEEHRVLTKVSYTY